MHVLACNAPQLRMMAKSGVSTSTQMLGRRELCFDGVSSVCSSSQPSTSSPSTSESIFIQRLFFSPFYFVLLHRLINFFCPSFSHWYAYRCFSFKFCCWLLVLNFVGSSVIHLADYYSGGLMTTLGILVL